MTSGKTIRRVLYQWGLSADASDWSSLRTIILEGQDIPEQVISALRDEDLLAEEGEHGVPDAGEPVEIDHLEVEHDRGVTAITVYNRGIMLFTTNDDFYPRFHRVCSAIERSVE